MTSSSVLSNLQHHITTLHTWPHHHHQAVLFECFRQDPLSGHVGRHKLYSFRSPDQANRAGRFRNVLESVMSTWKSAGNSNKLQSSNPGKCKQWMWCIHFSRAPTKTCAFWSLVTFNSGRWNCSLWGRKWHFPFRGAKTSYDGVCFHFQTACWIFVMGH